MAYSEPTDYWNVSPVYQAKILVSYYFCYVVLVFAFECDKYLIFSYNHLATTGA